MSDSADGSRTLTTHPECEYYSLEPQTFTLIIFDIDESAKDTDVIIQSSDGVIFNLHWKYLQLYPGFVRDVDDGSQPNEEKEKMDLDEPSDVLEILFQFVYPKRHPSLEDIDFETLAAVAEAVEKYQVFSAMNLCALRLERFLPCEQHATRILIYSTKYNYTKLANEAALSLCRKPDLEVVKQLPAAMIMPWLTYRSAWKALFDARLQKTMERCVVSIRCSSTTFRVESSISICAFCTTSTLAWFQFLENLDRLSDLKSSLIALMDERNLPSQYQLHSYRFGKSNFAKFSNAIKGGCDQCLSRCQHMSSELEELSKDIEAIPPFTEFLKSY
ncbi:hypothetical protein M413DRAFT_24933 [Hebeloma cylindrosporum]|uniref:BTB domain-containing protein n=1 Tax=Hebeloma cylindrosporum TaxID=76867 RepID=A0A0C3C6B9_HEBCY|nr:hypothetical protein M413DRAFT_24933 [Hebeloma cylindrosporum h7]